MKFPINIVSFSPLLHTPLLAPACTDEPWEGQELLPTNPKPLKHLPFQCCFLASGYLRRPTFNPEDSSGPQPHKGPARVLSCSRKRSDVGMLALWGKGRGDDEKICLPLLLVHWLCLFSILCVLMQLIWIFVKAFRCSTAHTRRQRPKNVRFRRKSKKYKNTYDELCQKTIWEIGVLEFFWFSAGTCRAFLPDRPAGDLLGAWNILTLQEKHQNFLRRYLAGDLPGIWFLPTCRDLPDRWKIKDNFMRLFLLFYGNRKIPKSNIFCIFTTLVYGDHCSCTPSETLNIFGVLSSPTPSVSMQPTVCLDRYTQIVQSRLNQHHLNTFTGLLHIHPSHVQDVACALLPLLNTIN